MSNSRRLIVGVVDAGGQQPGGELVGVGPGVAEPEGAGVGGQPGVEAGGQLLVERDAELVEEAGDQGDRGRRAAVDQPDVAEAGVAGVVVDDDGDARRRRAAPASSPSRPGEAASRLTNTSGDDGTADEGTSPSAPGSQPSDSGSVNGSGKVVSTRAPRRRRPSASARVLPSASASGCTCPERTTVARASAASARTEAAVRAEPR